MAIAAESSLPNVENLNILPEVKPLDSEAGVLWRQKFISKLEDDVEKGPETLPEGVTFAEYKNWVEKKVWVEVVGPTQVVFVDYDHGDAQENVEPIYPKYNPPSPEEIDQMKREHNLNKRILYHFTKRTVAKTKGVVREYFGPELGTNTVDSEIINAYPNAQKKLSLRYVRQRLFGFNELNKLAAQTKQPIFTLDPANRPSYEAQYNVTKVAFALEVIGLVMLGISKAAGPEILPAAFALMGYQAFGSFFDKWSEDYGVGMYSRKEIGPLDTINKVILSHEDFRRVQTAQLLEELAQMPLEQKSEVNDEDTDVEDSLAQSLFFPLPRPHLLRIIMYLRKPPLIKRFLYKSFPFMDRSIREWRYDENVTIKSKRRLDKPGGWRLFKRHKK